MMHGTVKIKDKMWVQCSDMEAVISWRQNTGFFHS